MEMASRSFGYLFSKIMYRFLSANQDSSGLTLMVMLMSVEVDVAAAAVIAGAVFWLLFVLLLGLVLLHVPSCCCSAGDVGVAASVGSPASAIFAGVAACAVLVAFLAFDGDVATAAADPSGVYAITTGAIMTIGVAGVAVPFSYFPVVDFFSPLPPLRCSIWLCSLAVGVPHVGRWLFLGLF
ncbi:hypothetical protein Ancab_011304 [Ancistrocladus abbreviatus]